MAGFAVLLAVASLGGHADGARTGEHRAGVPHDGNAASWSAAVSSAPLDAAPSGGPGTGPGSEPSPGFRAASVLVPAGATADGGVPAGADGVDPASPAVIPVALDAGDRLPGRLPGSDGGDADDSALAMGGELPPLEYLTASTVQGAAVVAYRDLPPTGPVLGRTILVLPGPGAERGGAVAGRADSSGWNGLGAYLADAGYRVLIQYAPEAGSAGAPALPEDAHPELTRLLLDSLGAPSVAILASGERRALAGRLIERLGGRVIGMPLILPGSFAGIGDLSETLERWLEQ